MVSQLLQRPLLFESLLTQYRISVQRYTNVSAISLAALLPRSQLFIRHDSKNRQIERRAARRRETRLGPVSALFGVMWAVQNQISGRQTQKNERRAPRVHQLETTPPNAADEELNNHTS